MSCWHAGIVSEAEWERRTVTLIVIQEGILYNYNLCSQLMGSLEEVHMPQNGINHPGVTALATAMQHNAGLRILNLNDNTFTEKGAIAMAQVQTHYTLVS